MLSFFYERRYNVIRAQVTGVLSSEDIVEHDNTLLNFLAGMLAREQKVRGLYDFSAVEALAVPTSKINQFGQRPAIIEDLRVVVAPPGSVGFAYVTALSEQRRAAGLRLSTIVSTLEEAYELMGLEDPQFDRIG